MKSCAAEKSASGYSLMKRVVSGCLRTILQGYSEDWISGKLYLSEPMERIKETLKKPIPFEATRDGLEPCSVGYASSAGLQPVAAR